MIEKIKEKIEKERDADDTERKSVEYWEGYNEALDFALWVIEKVEEGRI